MQATQAAFTRMLGIAVDAQGTVHFSDSGYGVADNNGGNNCVRAVDPSGALRTAVGRCKVFPHAYTEGSQATSALLDEPCGLAFAPGSRRLHVASYGHNAVRLVTLPELATPTKSTTRTRSTTASRSRSRKARQVA